MEKIVKSSNTPLSLIDCIAPENKLLSVRAIKNGVRFTFSERRLPPWFLEFAKQFNFAVVDDDPNKLRGRVVSFIDDTKRDRKS